MATRALDGGEIRGSIGSDPARGHDQQEATKRAAADLQFLQSHRICWGLPDRNIFPKCCSGTCASCCCCPCCCFPSCARPTSSGGKECVCSAGEIASISKNTMAALATILLAIQFSPYIFIGTGCIAVVGAYEATELHRATTSVELIASVSAGTQLMAREIDRLEGLMKELDTQKENLQTYVTQFTEGVARLQETETQQEKQDASLLQKVQASLSWLTGYKSKQDQLAQEAALLRPHLTKLSEQMATYQEVIRALEQKLTAMETHATAEQREQITALSVQIREGEQFLEDSHAHTSAAEEQLAALEQELGLNAPPTAENESGLRAPTSVGMGSGLFS